MAERPLTLGVALAYPRTGEARNAPAPSIARIHRRAWAGFGLCAGAASLLLSLAVVRTPYFDVDLRITRAVQATDLSALDLPLRALNAVGFSPLVVIVYGGVMLALYLAGKRWEATAGTFGMVGSVGINDLSKWIVNRPRPDIRLVHVEHLIKGSPSFPAGHVLNFTVFAGFLCCLLWLHVRPSWRRGALITALLAAIALMGLARIDSGEHWATDVLGGYLFGGACLSLTVLFYDWGRRRGMLARAPARARLSGFGILAILAVASPALFAGAAYADPDAADSLGTSPAAIDSLATSSEVPWNPPHKMHARRGWERAVLLPGRVLSLPLVGLGWAADNALLQMEQSPRFANVLAPPAGSPGTGVVLKTARMGDRAGLGGAIEVHADVLNGTLSSRVAAEYAATLHRYGRTLLTWTGHPLSLQLGEEWRPQDRFYGLGNGAAVGDATDYAMQREFVRGGLGWEWNRERDPKRVTSAIGIWGGPRDVVTRTGREVGVPSYQALFPAMGTATLNRRVEHLVYGGRLLLDERTGSPHWSRGWRTQLSAERFDVPMRALALRSSSADGAQFTRFTAEAEAGFSFMRDPRTVRLLVRVADQDAGARRDRMLISDLSTLGGQAGLGGFAPGRFHDMDLMLGRVDYLFPLQRGFEVDLHSEWGAVSPDLWRAGTPGGLHHSFGFSLRARSVHTPSAAIGFDFSREGARLGFSLGGSE